MSTFNVDGLRFMVTRPEVLDADQYRGIQELSREAYRAGFEGWEPEEIDAFVKWDEPEYFRASRLDPRVAQERGDLGPNQSWYDPIVVLAMHGDEIVGANSSWINVSGSKREQQLKMSIPPGLPIPKIGHRQVVWVREMVTHPDYWTPSQPENHKNKGLGHVVTYLALEKRHPAHPVVGYVMKSATRMRGIMDTTGFTPKPKEPTRVEVGGPGSREEERYRMEHKRAGKLMKHIVSMPGARHAIHQAHRSMAF